MDSWLTYVGTGRSLTRARRALAGYIFSGGDRRRLEELSSCEARVASQARCVRLDPARAIMTPVNRMRSLLVASLLCVAAAQAPSRSAPFVPIGVWYGGGTSRAPMVSRNPAAERDAWRRDLAAIKSLGFNSIKTWVDWASAEPERGRYRFDALEQLLSLADEAGLARHRPDLHRRGARMARARAIPIRVSSPIRERASDRRHHPATASITRVCAPTWSRSLARPPTAAARHPLVLCRRRLERTARGQLGLVQHAGRVLLLPAHAGAFPRLAEAEIPDARRRQRGVVSHVFVVGPSRGAAVWHHPFVHRFHRLEDVHRDEAARRISS